MLEKAKHAYAVNPNPDLESRAKALGWTVFFPEVGVEID
jgi:phosphoserine phosphatase